MNGYLRMCVCCSMQSVVETLRVVWSCKAGPVCVAACCSCPGCLGLLDPASETARSASSPAPASPSDGTAPLRWRGERHRHIIVRPKTRVEHENKESQFMSASSWHFYLQRSTVYLLKVAHAFTSYDVWPIMFLTVTLAWDQTHHIIPKLLIKHTTLRYYGFIYVASVLIQKTNILYMKNIHMGL